MEKASVASQLREGLRSYFDSVRNEPLPDAIADLVRRLCTSEQTPKAAQEAPQAERKRQRRR
jgi:Anti-sigma factor NepR